MTEENKSKKQMLTEVPEVEKLEEDDKPEVSTEELLHEGE